MKKPALFFSVRLALLGVFLAAPAYAQETARKLEVLETKTGVRFGIWGDRKNAPAPTLFILSSSLESSLNDAYFRQCGNTLARHGYLCVSIDSPCHGTQVRPKEPRELNGWRYHCEQNDDFVAESNERLQKVLDHLIAAGYTDPKKVAVCGTSRGGFLALHYAAHDARVKCVVAYAPVTELTALAEFRGTESNKLVAALSVAKQAEKLANRASWIIIGDRDTRVGTEHAVALERRIKAAALDKGLPNRVELFVVNEPRGHTTPAGAAEKSAEWLLAQFSPQAPK